MKYLKDIPTHVWLVFVCLVLLTCYYIRPDPIVQNLVIGFFSALLLALRTGESQRPPPHQGTDPQVPVVDPNPPLVPAAPPLPPNTLQH